MSASRIEAEYGVNETNGIEDPNGWIEHLQTMTETVRLGDPRLARVTRLRLLTERGYPYMDISYCHGVLKDGSNVRIQADVNSVSRKSPKAGLIAWAQREGAFAKGLGLLDESNWSVLYG